MKLILYSLIALFVLAGNGYSQAKVAIKSALLDLSGWNFEKKPLVKIVGDDGGNWKPTYYDKNEDTAVFSLTIITPERTNRNSLPVNLAIKIPPLHTKYELWVNGEIALSNGYNYIDKWKGDYQRYSQIISLNNENNSVDLFLKVYHFSNLKLIRAPILFGANNLVRQQRLWDMLQVGGIIGLFLFIFLINFFLWLAERKHYSFLLLGLYSLFQALQVIGKGESLLFLSAFSSVLFFKSRLLIQFLKLLFFNLFLFQLFKTKWEPLLTKIIWASTFIIIFTFSFLPQSAQPYFLGIYYILYIFSMLYFIYRSIKDLNVDKRTAFASLIALVILISSFLIDFAQYDLITLSISSLSYGGGTTLTYGQIIFVILFTYFLYLNTKAKALLPDISIISIDSFVDQYQISKRESEVLRLFIQRYSYKEISGKLFISLKTVETHIYHIYQKTGVNNKTELLSLIRSTKSV